MPCGLTIVVRFEQAAQRGPDAQHPEVRPRHHLDARELMLAAGGQIHLGEVAAKEAVEDRPLFLELLADRIRDFTRRPCPVEGSHFVALPVDQYQSLRLSHGQRAQQDLVEQRKNTSVRADTERQ